MKASRKTIKNAVKQIHSSHRKDFLELWEQMECADLYDGDLSAYIQIIKSSIMEKNLKIKNLKSLNILMSKVLEK